jgi:hypothetical protein
VYVGNLDPAVTEEMVWELFTQAGPVGEASQRRGGPCRHCAVRTGTLPTSAGSTAAPPGACAHCSGCSSVHAAAAGTHMHQYQHLCCRLQLGYPWWTLLAVGCNSSNQGLLDFAGAAGGCRPPAVLPEAYHASVSCNWALHQRLGHAVTTRPVPAAEPHMGNPHTDCPVGTLLPIHPSCALHLTNPPPHSTRLHLCPCCLAAQSMCTCPRTASPMPTRATALWSSGARRTATM